MEVTPVTAIRRREVRGRKLGQQLGDVCLSSLYDAFVAPTGLDPVWESSDLLVRLPPAPATYAR